MTSATSKRIRTLVPAYSKVGLNVCDVVQLGSGSGEGQPHNLVSLITA
jgi:hypothetical protein